MKRRYFGIEQLIDEIRDRYAPDPRTCVFEVRCELDGDTLRLVGVTTEHEAAMHLHREAALLDEFVHVVDEVRRLPAEALDQPRHALVSAAVVPMLAGPNVTATHLSQVVLGRRLTLLRRAGRWYQCRAEDGYLGWVHQGYLVLATELEAREWELAVGGEACTSLGAVVRSDDDSLVARLPWGARAVHEANGQLRLPDGRRGSYSGEVVMRRDRPSRFPRRADAITGTALGWVGAPYLWGGVTPAGVDCSGFVQAVFALHGVDLPRDSDQQAGVGAEVDTGAEFTNLRPGDLLFFAERGEYVSHVVISLGGHEILHASLGNGGVALNTLTGELPYERELRSIFVCARRYL